MFLPLVDFNYKMGPTLPQATARYMSHPGHMCTQCGQIASVRQIE